VARLKKDEPQRRQQGLKAAIRRAISGPDLDPTLLGYGGIWLMMDEAHVSTLAVHADWQGKGIGELLLVSLIEKAMTLSAEFVTLEVRVSNDRAQNLYRKYGFRQVGVRRKYYSDNNEDALIMTTDDIQAPTYQGQYQRLTRELDAKLSAQSAPSSSEVTGDNGA
jgi:ribosomal-protein-alanine N-acetyltransferase